MASFTVGSATKSDLPDVAAISLDAFISNPRTMSYWMLKGANREDLLVWRLSHMTHIFETQVNQRFYKLVDDKSGRIVAFTLWQFPTSIGSIEDEAEMRKMNDEHEEQNPCPKGINEALLFDFEQETNRMRAKYVDKFNDYVLKNIATLPEYQTKGYASALLGHGLKQVDAVGARAWLEATPQGHPVYMKYGWRDVDQIVCDLGKYGSEGVQVTTCMERIERKLASVEE